MSLIKILNSKQRPLSSPKLRCYTCLTLDRNLNPLKDKCLLSMLCPEMFLRDKANAQYLICWECEFMIIKIKRFQARLMKAHTTLKLSLKGITTVVEGLSNLKSTGIETINILPQTPIHHEQSSELVKLEVPPVHPVQIKIEKSESLSGDYDELIQPTAIPHHQLSSGESTDTASETDVLLNDDPLLTLPRAKPSTQKEKFIEIHVPPLMAVKDVTVAPNVNHTPQKPLFNTPLANMTLKGLLEAVKAVPNLIGKETIPILVRESPQASSIPILVKESPQASSKEGEQSPGLYGCEEDGATCKILNRTEMETYRSKRRENQAFKGCQYKCEKCIERFYTQQYFDEHNKKHDKANGNFICNICEQRFPDGSVRDEHYKGHFLLYECQKCPYQNQRRIAITEHMRRVHEVSRFSCRKCDAVLKTFREHRQHIMKVHNKRFTCEECGKSFCAKFALQLHIANAHKKERVECTLCKKKVLKSSMYAHMKMHNRTEDDSVYCVDCETVYKSKQSYETHLKTTLKHNKVEQLGIKCDHCNEYFSRKSSLRDHMDQINDIKYTCDACKKDFKTKKTLTRHIRFHHEGLKPAPKSSVCEICGKIFTEHSSLQEHINSHLGLRPYVCKDCGDTFSYSGALFTHRRLVHKVKRRYEMPR